MKKLLFLLILSIPVFQVSLLFPETSSASFNIPWSTTFDCNEQDQSTSGWPNCGGLGAGGAGTTAAGAECQITSAANFADGGGGRGQRTWYGAGTNNLSCGGSPGYNIAGNSNQPELYIRWYQRWEAGFRWASGFKQVYFIDVINRGSSAYFAMEMPNTIRYVAEGNPIITVNSGGWNTMMGGSSASDGAWHCQEIHYKAETSNGAGNGVLEWYIDGVRRLNFTGNIGFPNSGAGFHNWGLPSNDSRPSGVADAYSDVDDVVAQTTGPIGCTYGVPVSNAPTPPQNLQIR